MVNERFIDINLGNKCNFRCAYCYEDNMEFCHRHIVAAWLELSLGIEINEIVVKNGKIVNID